MYVDGSCYNRFAIEGRIMEQIQHLVGFGAYGRSCIHTFHKIQRSTLFITWIGLSGGIYKNLTSFSTTKNIFSRSAPKVGHTRSKPANHKQKTMHSIHTSHQTSIISVKSSRIWLHLFPFKIVAGRFKFAVSRSHLIQINLYWWPWYQIKILNAEVVMLCPHPKYSWSKYIKYTVMDAPNRLKLLIMCPWYPLMNCCQRDKW